MESREQRIATLATTLRSSGIAKSDSQAKMMAEDMIGVEEHVQRDYEVEHARAHEYLKTTKNLGMSRPTAKSESKIEMKQDPSLSDLQEPTGRFEELYTSGNLSSAKPSTQASHDTHNSALEAIKTQISQARTEPVIHDEFIPVDKLVSIPIKDDIIESMPKENLNESQGQVLKESSDVESLVPPEAPKFVETKTTIVAETSPILETPIKEAPKVETVEEPKLDAKRLLDLMEEDGKLEEHTREIKEKPKDVKPKEAYEENNIDLGNMFDFNKGTMRK